MKTNWSILYDCDDYGNPTAWFRMTSKGYIYIYETEKGEFLLEVNGKVKKFDSSKKAFNAGDKIV